MAAVDGNRAEVIIRVMEQEEKREVRRMVRRNLPLIMSLMFFFGRENLVALRDGAIVGVVTYKTFPMGRGRRGGILSWGAVAKSERGQGTGSRLYQKAVERLRALGADELFGCVEGRNPGSWLLLERMGFHLLSFTRQLRRYGPISLARIWYHSFHLPDVGHFLWVRRADGDELPREHTSTPHQLAAWLGNLLAMTLLALLAQWRWQPDRLPSWEAAVITLASFALLFGVRELLMRGAAAVQGYRVLYRTWETGYTLGGTLALLFGAVFPVPGSEYPRHLQGSHREHARRLGVMALASTLGLLALLTLLAQLQPVLNADPPVLGGYIKAIAHWTRIFGQVYLVVDVLLPFFPFVAYNGRRLWDWHPLVWLVSTLLVVGYFVFV